LYRQYHLFWLVTEISGLAASTFGGVPALFWDDPSKGFYTSGKHAALAPSRVEPTRDRIFHIENLQV
jgi:hypothetical protein